MKRHVALGTQASLCGTGIVEMSNYNLEINGQDVLHTLLEELLGDPDETGYQRVSFAGTIHLTIERLDEALQVENDLVKQVEVSKGLWH